MLPFLKHAHTVQLCLCAQAPSPSLFCQGRSCSEMSTTSTKTCLSGNLSDVSVVASPPSVPLLSYNLHADCCLCVLQDTGWLSHISLVENV